MSTFKGMANITKPSRSAFINEASTQSNAQNLIKVCFDSYFFSSLVEYDDFWNFSITCQLLFKLNNFVNYKLNRKYSQMYCSDEQIRTEILQKIYNPQKQLYLNLSNCNNIINFGVLRNIHTLDLSGYHNITDVSPLRNINTINLSGCYKITDVRPLEKVRKLNLSHCVL